MIRFLFNSVFCFAITIVLLIAATAAKADQNDTRLELLFQQLKTSISLQNAASFEIQIWQIWMEHQNPESQSSLTKAIEALQQQKFEQALGQFSLLIEIEPEFAEGWNKRATVLYLMGRFQESDADVLRTIELEPRHFGALSGQGLIRMVQEDWSGAVESFETALGINPHMPGAIRNLKYARKRMKESMT
jgi:tetratricopeptide (TPR) repeat protein